MWRVHLASAFSSLLAVSCASAQAPATAATRTAVAAGVTTAQAELVRSQGTLRHVQVAGRSGEPAQQFVQLQDVQAALLRGRTTLLARLQGDSLAGLRSYVNRFYPASVPLAASLPTAGASLTSETDAMNAFAKANAFLGKVDASGKLAVDLDISSQPAQASFVIEADGGAGRRATSTNATVRNIYRGLYGYRVTLAGFKTISDSLNLVDDDGRRLECRLVRTQDAAAATPCVLKP